MAERLSEAANKFVSITAEVVYRGLEKPHLFHIQRDELYELDEKGLAFLDEVDGTRRVREIREREVLAYADAEGLLYYSDKPLRLVVERGVSPSPSLRYLELILTRRCNLRCRHCYLGEQTPVDLSARSLERVVREFDEMQGLRLLLSGGEPLLYPYLDRFPDLLEGRGFRVALLTNGYALTSARLKDLPVHEIQISLDGMEKGHDSMRGLGSFRRAVEAARLVGPSGKDLSIATMICTPNLAEIRDLADLVRELGAREWSLEVPSSVGRWRDQGEDLPSEQIAEFMALGFGASSHGPAEGYACGRHLAAVMPNGDVCACGFYAATPLGNLKDTLRLAWSKKKVKPLADLPWCQDCPAAEKCGGGCRYRAAGPGPDPVMCAAYGWPKGKPPEAK